MRYCTNCGHKLGVGRYCTNCGARVAALPTEAALPPLSDFPTIARSGELPPIPTVGPAPGAIPVAPPPPLAGPPPSSARYPLYADAVQPPATPASYAVAPARRRSATPWLVAFVVLALLALTGGALLLLAPSDDKDAKDATEGKDGVEAVNADNPDPGANEGQSSDSADPPAGASRLVPADVSVPGTAPASVDQDGNRVTFAATNMLDGDPRTSWRMDGDGSGSTISLQFDDAVTVTEVGLINGYAKTDPPHDWYQGNRRIASVVWVFDDGTEITQDFDDNRDMQTVPVSAVETTSVELRILEVSDPGHGPDARDYTAISDIQITGGS